MSRITSLISWQVFKIIIPIIEDNFAYLTLIYTLVFLYSCLDMKSVTAYVFHHNIQFQNRTDIWVAFDFPRSCFKWDLNDLASLRILWCQICAETTSNIHLCALFILVEYTFSIWFFNHKSVNILWHIILVVTPEWILVCLVFVGRASYLQHACICVPVLVILRKQTTLFE